MYMLYESFIIYNLNEKKSIDFTLELATFKLYVLLRG